MVCNPKLEENRIEMIDNGRMVFDSRLSKVNLIIAAGSVDGVATTAAFMRAFHNLADDVIFCQAFEVDKIDARRWKKNRMIMIIDLGVNSRDKKMTEDFIRQIVSAGHKIVGICDEHDADQWKDVIEANDLKIEDLAIRPVTRNLGEIKSSGALLRDYVVKFGYELRQDSHLKELFKAADEADRMNFSSHFAWLMNAAMKADIKDDTRRFYMAGYFSDKYEPDEKIARWVSRYAEILMNNQICIANAEERYADMAVTDTYAYGEMVDITVIMSELYEKYPVTVVCAPGRTFIGARPGYQLNILDTLSAKGILASGMPQRASVSPKETDVALVIIAEKMAEIKIENE